jgi:hypothetical protein
VAINRPAAINLPSAINRRAAIKPHTELIAINRPSGLI